MPPKIAVCLLTYKRPNGLRHALQGLARQQVKDGQANVRFFVINNDAEHAACDSCAAAVAEFGERFTYVCEPRRGISYGRNRALDLAADCDFLVFLDDDEVPEANWLSELLSVQATYEADFVCGPVMPHFGFGAAPEWAVRGRFFERPRYPAGSVLRGKDARTGNVLMSVSFVEKYGLDFCHAFALSGGSDRHFFLHAERFGGRIVWADNATVVEWLPESRVNVSWLLRRQFRFGNTSARVQLLSDGWNIVSLQNILAGGARIGIGLMQLLISGAVKHKAIAGACTACCGLGILYGYVGGTYVEYKTVHRV
jgi:succinoglycan biosynthesis protein ExoM